jgi:hypothetical protein
MIYRLNFDDDICRDLIEKISRRANGGNPNKALQTMVLEWNAIENDRNMIETCQIPIKNVSKQPDSDEQLETALASIDADF